MYEQSIYNSYFVFTDYIATGLEKTKEDRNKVQSPDVDGVAAKKERKEVLRVTPSEDVLRSYHWYGAFTYAMLVCFVLLMWRLRAIAREEQAKMAMERVEQGVEQGVERKVGRSN